MFHFNDPNYVYCNITCIGTKLSIVICPNELVRKIVSMAFQLKKLNDWKGHMFLE